jgi:hypothetical protein
MSSGTTRKETIEFDAEFLESWNQFCMEKGLSKRQASHAAILTFKNLTADEREKVLAESAPYVAKGKNRLGPRKKEETSS